jgi:hypothetical protein
MKNKKYIWLTIAILGVGGYFIYKEYKKPKSSTLTFEESLDIIIEGKNASNRESLSTFDKPFVIAWANGVLAKAKTFSYNGKEYNTQGGTSVK